LLFPVDEARKPRHLYIRASLVGYRSLVKQTFTLRIYAFQPRASLRLFKMVPYHFVRPASLTTTDDGNAGFAGEKTCPTRPCGQALAIR